MALTVGTNCGFITVSPTDDPAGMTWQLDTVTGATRDVVPAGKNAITEVGWYCDNATQEANFEIGLYSHDSDNNKPDTLLFSTTTNAKGTGAGWKKVEVSWSVTPEETYWIVVQLDDTATTTNTNLAGSNAAYWYANISPTSTLPSPWGAGNAGQQNYSYGVYALVEEVEAPSYSELSGTIAAESNVSGNLDTTAISTLSGTIASVSTVSGNLSTTSVSALSGTITATSDVWGNLGSTSVGIDIQTSFIKRLVVAGRNRLYYEDI